MKENFVICIESMHIADTGKQNNVSICNNVRCLLNDACFLFVYYIVINLLYWGNNLKGKFF